VVVTKQIEAAIREELNKQITESSARIREALVAHLQTKKGANKVAELLIDGMNDTFKNNWRSSVNITLEQLKRD